jgi:hypothetical protein
MPHRDKAQRQAIDEEWNRARKHYIQAGNRRRFTMRSRVECDKRHGRTWYRWAQRRARYARSTRRYKRGWA